MYSTFLFDMDGTLVDTFHLIFESFNIALAANGLRQLTEQEFSNHLFGKPIDGSLQALVGTISQDQTKKLLRDFQDLWLRELRRVRVFREVPETLRLLKLNGARVGVVSTSPRGVIEETLKVAGILCYFDVIIGDEDAQKKKPDPEPVLKALKHIGACPAETVYVGDTIYDIIAGKAAGCTTVLMLNSHNRDVPSQSSPDAVLHKFKDLLSLSDARA